MGLGRLEPPVRVRVAHQREKPAQESEAVVPTQPEPLGMDGKGVGESVGVLAHRPDRIHDESRHRLRVLLVAEEVRGDPRRARHGQPMKCDPLGAVKVAG